MTLSIAIISKGIGTDQDSLLTRECIVNPASKTEPAGIMAPGGFTVMSTTLLCPTASVPVEP